MKAQKPAKLLVRNAALMMCLLIGPALQAGTASTPTLVVSTVTADQPAVGEAVREMLITGMAKTRKFQVLDKRESHSSDYTLRCAISFSGSKNTQTDPGGLSTLIPNLPINIRKISLETAEIHIEWRIVDSVTDAILHADKGVGKERGGSFNLEGDYNINFDLKKFKESAAIKAAIKAVEAVVAEVKKINVPPSGRQQTATAPEAAKSETEAAKPVSIYPVTVQPGRVTGVAPNGIVVISLGSKHGLKKGDTLKLYAIEETKDDQGNVLFREEKQVGELVLEAVQDEISKAVTQGETGVQKGWTVKTS